jgi:hypothetical protein
MKTKCFSTPMNTAMAARKPASANGNVDGSMQPTIFSGVLASATLLHKVLTDAPHHEKVHHIEGQKTVHHCPAVRLSIACKQQLLLVSDFAGPMNRTIALFSDVACAPTRLLDAATASPSARKQHFTQIQGQRDQN